MKRRGCAFILCAAWLLFCCAAPVCALRIDGVPDDAEWRGALTRIWIENGPKDGCAVRYADVSVLPAADRKSLALLAQVEDGALALDTGAAGLTVQTGQGTLFFPAAGEAQYDAKQAKVTFRSRPNGAQSYRLEALIQFAAPLPEGTAEMTAYLTDGAGVWTAALALPAAFPPDEPEETDTTRRAATTARPTHGKTTAAKKATVPKTAKEKTSASKRAPAEKAGKTVRPARAGAEGTQAVSGETGLQPSDAEAARTESDRAARFNWKKGAAIGAAVLLLAAAAVLLVLRGRGGDGPEP